MLTLTGKAPRIKFNYLNNEDIVKFDEQIDKVNDLSKYKIKPQVSVYTHSETKTWYSAEILLKDRYGLWNDTVFLSLDGCSSSYEQTSEYVKELEKYVKFKVLEQQIEEYENENIRR